MSEELTSQAEQLQSAIAFFKIDHNPSNKKRINIVNSEKKNQVKAESLQKPLARPAGISLELESGNGNGDAADDHFENF